MKLYDLTDREVQVLLLAIHHAQDDWAVCADEMAKSEALDDQVFGRLCEERSDILDVVRKKLGDTWEPDPSYRVPDSPEGL